MATGADAANPAVALFWSIVSFKMPVYLAGMVRSRCVVGRPARLI